MDAAAKRRVPLYVVIRINGRNPQITQMNYSGCDSERCGTRYPYLRLKTAKSVQSAD